MSNWKEYKLSDIADIIGGGTPSTSEPAFWNGNIPWLTPRDLTGYTKTYIGQGERSITENGLSNSSARILPKGSVLITSRAPIGYVAIAENAVCTNQGFKSLVLDNSKAKNRFIYYWVKNNVEYLQSIGTGTTFMEISGSTLRDVSIMLPPIEEQEAIAEVLSSLDDKIDLLHRQNTTLEALAQTYFRQWFVKEVSANSDDAESKNLNVSKKASDSATPPQNEKKLARLGDYASVQGGYAFKSSDFCECGDVKILKIKNIAMSKTDLSSIQYVNNNVIMNLSKEKLMAINGDFVIAMTGAEIGKIGIVIENEKPVWVNQRVGKLKSNEKGGSIIAYFYLSASEGQDYIINTASGSAQENISTSQIENMPVKKVSEDVVKSFNNIVMPFFEKIILNSQQILILQKLRDTLLPKLINGDVSVI